MTPGLRNREIGDINITSKLSFKSRKKIYSGGLEIVRMRSSMQKKNSGLRLVNIYLRKSLSKPFCWYGRLLGYSRINMW